jgi:zinc/manganese transport system substrate-binding protein/manganese/iron transport system substrate-binding protein
LSVVATTSIVADVVRNVGHDLIELTTLIPPDTDPHSFEPTPRDATAIANADVVFSNGAGLEPFLDKLISSAGDRVVVVQLSESIDLLTLEEEAEHHEDDGEHAEGLDPHTWFDPNNVVIWVDNINHTLVQLDPEHEQLYEENATAYQAELAELDRWIRDLAEQIPKSDRKLVTDHMVFGHLARQYGFTQVGAVFPGYNTLAEPSAQELAQLLEAIRETNVHAIFVGMTTSSELAERIAEDTGVEIIRLYTGSLSAPGGPADTYIAFMEHNVTAIADGLR